MTHVPIAFSIDQNMILPFQVCIKSLLNSAHSDTFYDIFVLHNAKKSSEQMRQAILNVQQNDKCSVTLVDADKSWENAFEIRNISVATYYRLMLPMLLPQYPKIIYADADVIFQSDLAHIYQSTLQNNQLVAGVREIDDFIQPDNKIHTYYKQIGCDMNTYINGGFIILNLNAMRQENITDKFMQHVHKKYLTQDQDILNIVCRNRIELIPFRWNYTSILYHWANNCQPFAEKYADEIEIANASGTVHYTGPKPWNTFSTRFHIWWNVRQQYNPDSHETLYQVETRILEGLTTSRTKLIKRIFNKKK